MHRSKRTPPTSCYWVRPRPHRETLPRHGATLVQQSYHDTSCTPTKKHHKPAIPGGVYMISPIAAVSIWAALKLKLVAWRPLCVWIALWEVRTWRDTMEPAQRNLFRFTPRRIAQALGNRRAGPQLTQAIEELERLGLARLNPTEISFTTSLIDLPPELAAETERMLKSLGNRNVTRAIRMPRRLIRLVMRSRSRPLRVAVLFGMLLRIMSVKRYGWYKGCLTTALLVDVSGFHESSVKRERAALIREGYFERLPTSGRTRRQFGDWYRLAHSLPVLSGPKTEGKRRPVTTKKEGIRRPLIRKPAPSFGIETNQFLQKSPGASLSTSTPKTATVPSWHRISTKDFREPARRSALYEDARQKGVIGSSPSNRMLFYSAMARARRLGNINTCGMLRRIVETQAYHAHITGTDEDQGRAWLAEDVSQDTETTVARDLLRIAATHDTRDQFWNHDDSDPRQSFNAKENLVVPAIDLAVVSDLTQQLERAGFPIHNAFDLLMTTQLGRTTLAGWTKGRWLRASRTQKVYSSRQSGVTHVHSAGPMKPPAAEDKCQSQHCTADANQRHNSHDALVFQIPKLTGQPPNPVRPWDQAYQGEMSSRHLAQTIPSSSSTQHDEAGQQGHYANSCNQYLHGPSSLRGVEDDTPEIDVTHSK